MYNNISVLVDQDFNNTFATTIKSSRICQMFYRYRRKYDLRCFLNETFSEYMRLLPGFGGVYFTRSKVFYAVFRILLSFLIFCHDVCHHPMILNMYLISYASLQVFRLPFLNHIISQIITYVKTSYFKPHLVK